jgi:hypothetical protein
MVVDWKRSIVKKEMVRYFHKKETDRDRVFGGNMAVNK